MNILLLWPFIHPNLYPVLVSFKEYGFNVTLVIENEPKTTYEIPSKKIYVTASSIDNDSQFELFAKPAKERYFCLSPVVWWLWV